MSTANRLAQQRLLIVDDAPVNLAVLVEALESAGAYVAVAEDGAEALVRAEYVQPDLILLDVLMPGIDGFETCRRLKNNPRTRDIPVIFMTAQGGHEHKDAGFAAGGIDYVTKPFHMAELIARVDTHITLRAYRRRLAEPNEQCFRQATDLSPEAILIESENRIVYANEASARLFGARGVDELRSRSLLSLVSVQEREDVASAFAALGSGAQPQRLRTRAQRFDGSTFAAVLTIAAGRFDACPAITVVAQRDGIDA